MNFVMSDVPKLATQLSAIIEQTPTYRPHIELGRSFAEEIAKALAKVNAKDSVLDKAERVLTPIEFRIWRTLYQTGTVIDAGTLLEVSGTKNEGALWVHMRRMRDKLMICQELGDVVTVHGRGYLWQRNG